MTPTSALSSSSTSAGDRNNALAQDAFVPHEVLVGLKAEAVQSLLMQGWFPSEGEFGIASLDQLSQRLGAQQIVPVFTQLDHSDPLVSKHGLAGVFRLTFPESVDIFAAMSEYRQHPEVEYVEPNLIYRTASNDTEFNRQWALHNAGQTNGTPDADIDAPEAWGIERGKSSMLIAIIDTGVNYNHPDLVGKVRTDIDKDFVNNDDDAMDDHGHGTFCAGIAAANTDNGLGIAGVCPNCQILPVKVLGSSGSGSASSVANGIRYAADKGAKIISMSLGADPSCGCSQTIARAINYAFERGSLLIAASGNDSNKSSLSYPAASPRVMSVGATDHNDREAGFSNRSPSLDILAPGVSVLSLSITATRVASGTSAAAPHVAGAAALVWSRRPELTNEQVWWILYHSADDLRATTTAAPFAASALDHSTANLRYKVFLPVALRHVAARTTAGRLNAHRALLTAPMGRITAPPDNCASDGGCGCPAEVTLSNTRAEQADLTLLRTLADEVFADHRIGQRWIELYQRHRLEAALILVSDEEFRLQVQQALEKWLPILQAVTQPNQSATTTVLTQEHIDALDSVIEGLALRGSARLRSDLVEVRRLLQPERFVGWDVRSAWQELVTQ
ncbi:MAG: S8 family peptidase [Anaerolineae bacterium]|nr:S8 family peptidase [Anaerolineae bacterium]